MSDEVIININGLDGLENTLTLFKAYIDVKAMELIDYMTSWGEQYAINQIGHIDTGETMKTIHGYRKARGKKGVIVAGGAAIWIEFGTGVGLNSGNMHPSVIDSSVPIYPHGEYGKGHGKNPSGWFYYDKKDGNKLKHTRGIRGNMFMYRTIKALYDNYPELAREVFGR